MPSIADIVEIINDHIDVEGAKKYGLAQTLVREKDRLPALVKMDGSTEYVGIDDKNKVSWYHKVNSLTKRQIPAQGYGRKPAGKASVFAMSMIVFINRKRINKYADEVVEIIEDKTPDIINQSIRITYNSVNLNDLQVYSQEYLASTYRLAPEHSLFQINYTVEVSSRGCFNTCLD